MKLVYFAIVVWTLCGLLGFGFSLPDSWVEIEQEEPTEVRNESPVTYKYDRIDEVKEECKSVLSSASELSPEDSSVYSIKRQISFKNGDWIQVNGKAPIMPFDVRYKENAYQSDRYFSTVPTEGSDPLNLVSFWVKDVNLAHRSKNSVSVSGLMTIGITANGNFGDYGYDQNSHFGIGPGQSELTIHFQGIYTESKRNGGERVVCMLGNTMLPDREINNPSSHPWEWVNASKPYENQQPPLLEDDRILLVLRFPKKFTLTSRAIRGEMRSLNPKSSDKYFDHVRVTSQLGSSANYEFTSEKIVSKACDPYPYKNGTAVIPVYKGNRFCKIIKGVTRQQAFTVLPNWQCDGEDNFCSKLGPFASANKGINATNGGFKGVNLYLQVIKCDQKTVNRYDSSARVSAVFRASPPSENRYTAAMRSGLGNMTVAAEGIWNSASGQLCMVGCPGIVDAEGNACDSRICLYIPISFSIEQRSIMYGTFSSLSTKPPSYFPLSFEMRILQPSELWNYFQFSRPSYNYTKSGLAGALLERNEEFSFRTVIKKSLLPFPKLEDSEAFEVSLSVLSEDLSLLTAAVPHSKTTNARPSRTEIQMDILSVGPLFRQYWSISSNSTAEEAPYRTKAQYSDNQLLLNVSAQLFITGKEYNNVSALFLEGLYDQRVGKMYLLGCRDVRASWQVLHDSMDLDNGLDCLIEVIVSYPPTTSRWLVDPTASISIASQRNDDDPLRFSPVKLRTFPISYRRQREDILSQRGIEGILRILTLSLAIACITSQLFYINQKTDSVPFMSLVMLGVEAIGYLIPLVTDAEALFKKESSDRSFESSSYDLENSRWFHVLDYMVKLLVMAALLLTLRLCQKVWKSRVRLQTRAPREPHRVPSDKKVLVSTLVIHIIGYILVLILHSMGIGQKPILRRSYAFSQGSSHVLSEWEIELEEYVGLVQDFFLLPQIISNIIWQIDSKPLRKLYYIGITVVRLLPHLYDYVRAPTRNPYFREEYEFVDPSMNFYSKFGDITIPLTAIVLAALVYVQQRWTYEKLSRSLTLGRCRLLPSASRMYERLPSNSKAFEAELASGANGSASNEEEHDLE
ncbi:hypothetical protein L484_003183 [Morus notabilis]|uniref:RING-type E3 ubiquitin transferase n=1 Tax=Morus notabilis TaxID=981085 RepID=W9RAK1_9ROSA|nr:uncharacterized protein LOC21386727 [Morus notabilis]EXB80182.1 hypothetical protein L484_003183 [Morus notabilis]